MQVQRIHVSEVHENNKLLESLRDTGFAVLQGALTISDSLEQIYKEWATFFASENKFRFLHTEAKQAGYFPFQSENAQGYSEKDLKEFFHIFSPFCTPAGMSIETHHLANHLQKLGEDLLKRIDQLLPGNVKANMQGSLESMADGSDQHLLRVLHYPPLDGKPGVRSAQHSDINLLTLLVSSGQAGLEVQDNEGVWHPLSLEKNEIALNVGDMAKVATNNYLRSTIHRVVNPTGEAAKESRYSLPFFLHARSKAKLTEKLTAGEFLDQRLHEIGLKKS